MAYRRRQQQHDEETSGTSSRSRPSPITTATSSSSSSPLDGEDWSYEDVRVLNDSNIKNKSNSASLATKAIRASSAAHRDSSLSSAYAFTNHPSPSPSPSSDSSNFNSSSTKEQESNKAFYHEYTSMKAMKETKQQQGFWGTLARKAKSILDDDFDADNNNAPSPPPPQKQHQHQQLDSATDRTTTRQHNVPDSAMPKYQNQFPSRETYWKTESPAFQKGLNAISSSLNYIGNAVEEGLTKVENRTSGIIQETRKHIRKKPNGAAGQNQVTSRSSMGQQPQKETEQELQLKASRDVAMAMAAKAKLLLRELKTVKADLAFAKERCAQLEEENKILRENRERGENLEDDDLIRLQLETLLAEKARLAHENSLYARENRFLREVVEYHQLTMQDVVYLDEGTEEVTEVYPMKVVSNIPSTSPTPLYTEASHGTSLPVTQDILPHPVPPQGSVEFSKSATSPNSYARHQLQQI
ncbi:cyclin-dependent kinase [Salix suchowensis]|nr:cyclin-dependent kinase [Salix suchowensis]